MIAVGGLGQERMGRTVVLKLGLQGSQRWVGTVRAEGISDTEQGEDSLTLVPGVPRVELQTGLPTVVILSPMIPCSP